MATSSGQPANVQAYLDKHKISTLFEVRDSFFKISLLCALPKRIYISIGFDCTTDKRSSC